MSDFLFLSVSMEIYSDSLAAAFLPHGLSQSEHIIIIKKFNEQLWLFLL